MDWRVMKYVAENGLQSDFQLLQKLHAVSELPRILDSVPPKLAPEKYPDKEYTGGVKALFSELYKNIKIDESAGCELKIGGNTVNVPPYALKVLQALLQVSVSRNEAVTNAAGNIFMAMLRAILDNTFPHFDYAPKGHYEAQIWEAINAHNS